MNRTIKFRAWDKKLKLFDDELFLALHGKLYDHAKEEFDTPNIEIDYVESKSRYELMQYTGLKDKNGTEIYEGDILSTDLDRPYLIVEFRNGAFMFQCHDNGKDYYDFMATTGENSNFTKYHEVIGNVYENSELLGCDGE